MNGNRRADQDFAVVSVPDQQVLPDSPINTSGVLAWLKSVHENIDKEVWITPEQQSGIARAKLKAKEPRFS